MSDAFFVDLLQILICETNEKKLTWLFPYIDNALVAAIDELSPNAAAKAVELLHETPWHNLYKFVAPPKTDRIDAQIAKILSFPPNRSNQGIG